MNNHEYKMLAYETRINLVPLEVADINDYIDKFSAGQIKHLTKGLMDHHMDPMLSIDALVQTSAFVDDVMTEYLDTFGMSSVDTLHRRIMVSYFAQRHAENILSHLVRWYNPENLLVVGGVFYNVKLNHLICNMVPGKFCVMPLCGDQGAGLGVYNMYFGDLQWPDHLFWGHRDLALKHEVPGIQVCNESTAMIGIQSELNRIGFVNLMRGSMEYGPRALCNTSTLALPDLGVGALINKMNNRTNEMPFALVMTKDQAEELFVETEKVHKSLEYMIMAREFKPGAYRGIEGGAHYYPLTDRYTCRPQITDDPFMVKLLNEFGPLVNTSWNYHGVPIVHKLDDALYTHRMEQTALPDVDFNTIIIP